MNAKLIVSVIVAAFALSACHHHHRPAPRPPQHVYMNHYQPPHQNGNWHKQPRPQKHHNYNPPRHGQPRHHR